jgi:hypothetical protein
MISISSFSSQDASEIDFDNSSLLLEIDNVDNELEVKTSLSDTLSELSSLELECLPI